MTWFNAFKFACKMYSIMFCFTQTYLLLFPMFALAYSSRTYEALIKINIYGEATMEMVIWGISFPFIAYGVYLNMEQTIRGCKK